MGKGTLVGEIVTGSIRPIWLKPWTEVEFFIGRNDDNSGGTDHSMTIASWQMSDGMFSNLKCRE